MQFHLGRLIDHVHLRVSDLDVSKRFYRAVLASLDLSALLVEGVDYFYLDELFVDRASGIVSHVHLTFRPLTGRRSTSSMWRPWLQVDATMEAPASVPITRATTRRLCWIRLSFYYGVSLPDPQPGQTSASCAGRRSHHHKVSFHKATPTPQGSKCRLTRGSRVLSFED